jgi:hypothetical protein
MTLTDVVCEVLENWTCIYLRWRALQAMLFLSDLQWLEPLLALQAARLAG